LSTVAVRKARRSEHPQLLRALGERYPDLAPHLADGVAVAIDGEIFQDAWLEPTPPDTEVHVIPQIVGGSLAARQRLIGRCSFPAARLGK
jgi:hypothetical protein